VPWEPPDSWSTPTLDLTDDQNLEIVDVWSGLDSEVNLSYQTLLTSDIEPDFDLPTLGLSASAADIPLTDGILDTGADGP